MTVPATDAKGGPYTGDGIQTDYPFDFPIFLSTDLTVTIDDDLSVSVVDVADYSVTFDGTFAVPGGTVVLNSALGDGFELTITRNPSFSQNSAFEVGEILYPPTLERTYDLLTFQTQYLNQAYLDLVIAVNAMFVTEGAGNVVGGTVPTTVNNIAVYSDTSGLLIKDSGIAVSGIATNASDIAANVITIAANAAAIVANATAITAITREPNGMILSNDTDADNDINVAAGYIYDSLNTTPILLASEITKKIDVDWVAGDDAGGFPSALTLAIDTWYYVFVIYNPTTDTTDAGFDTSLTAINLLADATGYTKYRYLGSVLTDGSSDIIPGQWTNLGGGSMRFDWDVPISDFSGDLGVTTAVTQTVSSPLGLNVIYNASAKVRWAIAAAGMNHFIFTNLNSPDTAPTQDISNVTAYGGDSEDYVAIMVHTKTNLSSQIRVRRSSTNSTLYLTALGYTYKI